MNPSFVPPPPLPNMMQEEIYQRYMADPEANNIRYLSSQYGISLKRVDAILRLKGLEKSWEKVGARITFSLGMHSAFLRMMI